MARPKKTKSKIDPSIWVILIGGLLLVVAIVVLLIQSQQTSPLTNNPQDPNIPYPEVERISVQDAKAAFDAGTAVFVDTRTLDSYNASHIPGALSIPENEVDSRFTELNPNDWIITYCT